MARSSWRRWLNRISQSYRQARPTQRAKPPRLELLEDRTVLSVTYHGGDLLTYVHVESVFYGSLWNSYPQQQASINQYLQYMVQSPYMDMLGEYYQSGVPSFDPNNVGRGVFNGSQVFTADNPGAGATVLDSTIRNNLVYDLYHGLPSLNNFEDLYIVFLPPGVHNDICQNGVLGYHSSLENPYSAPDGTTTYLVQYAVIPWPGQGNEAITGLTDPFKGVTAVTSHELSEAVTDPNAIWSSGGANSQSGWYDASRGNHGEIGDLAEGYFGILNGYTVQAEWSNRANSPVLPSGATWLTAGGSGGGGGSGTGVDSPGTVVGPIAYAHSYRVAMNGSLTVSTGNGVLTSDYDPYGNPLQAIEVIGPAHGSLGLGANGSFVYTPTPGFYGTDAFTYEASDGFFTSAPASVTITVTAPPSARADSYQVVEGGILSVSKASGVLANDYDPLGYPLQAIQGTGPSHGSLALNADGSFVYTPRAGFFGADTFTYLATDGLSASAPATVSITVTMPPVETAILKSDGSLIVEITPGVFAPLSPAGTILSVSATTDATGHAVVYAIAADRTLWEYSTAGWTLLSAGSFLQISAAKNSAGASVIFAVPTDNSLWENSSLFAGGWTLLSPGGTILSVSAVTGASGADDVFAITADRNIWEHTPAGWTLLSVGSFLQVGAGLSSAGQAVVYGVGTDESLWEYNPAFYGGWQMLDGPGKVLSVSAGSADEVFAITWDQNLWEYQRTTGWAWLSSGTLSSISGEATATAHGDVFAVAADSSFWEYSAGNWQELLDGGVAASAVA